MFFPHLHFTLGISHLPALDQDQIEEKDALAFYTAEAKAKSPTKQHQQVKNFLKIRRRSVVLGHAKANKNA